MSSNRPTPDQPGPDHPDPTDPTEELDIVGDATDEFPDFADVFAEGPMESERENNGPPLMWLAVAVVLLAAAVGAIVAIGRNRDSNQAAGVDTSVTTAADSTVDTPLVGDPGASATDDFGSSDDTSPPDETAEDATVPTSSSTTSVTTDDSGDASASDPSGVEGEQTTLDVPEGPLIIGSPTLVVASDDFEIQLATSACTTIEWSFAGEGQAANYTSELDCFDEHILSPRPEHPLLPATDYEVTAAFEGGGQTQVVSFSVRTAP